MLLRNKANIGGLDREADSAQSGFDSRKIFILRKAA
jgi:hypothetical protein